MNKKMVLVVFHMPIDFDATVLGVCKSIDGAAELVSKYIEEYTGKPHPKGLIDKFPYEFKSKHYKTGYFNFGYEVHELKN